MSLKILSRKPHLFNKGNFKLHSGSTSDFIIDCKALTDSDLETLAYLISKRQVFKEVVGVPKGGLRFAKALEKYTGDVGPVLLVDDVLTTGKSMEEWRKKIEEKYKPQWVKVKGYVIFARSEYPFWISSVFKMF